MWSHVWVGEGATGSPEAPFRFTRCWFEAWLSGLVMQGAVGAEVAWGRVDHCRFEPQTRQLELIREVRGIAIERNVFVGGSSAILLDGLGGASGQVTIDHNTCFGTGRWIDPTRSSPDLPGIRITHNAVLEPSGSASGPALAATRWLFGGNLSEVAGTAGDKPAARPQAVLEVLSRDPRSPEFLRPAPGSALLLPDGEVVGALEPANPGVVVGRD